MNWYEIYEIALNRIELTMQTEHTQSDYYIGLPNIKTCFFVFNIDQLGELLYWICHKEASNISIFVIKQIN